MITLLALSLLCLVAVVVFCAVGGVILALGGLALVVLLVLLPWVLRMTGVVLLIKGLLEKPARWEYFMPAVIAFVLAALIGWLF